MARTRRGFGAIRRLPSTKYQASYTGPDQARHSAPVTFSTREDAEGWLLAERRLVESDNWTSPAIRQAVIHATHDPAEPVTVKEFVTSLWLPTLNLRPATRRDYDGLLENHIFPTFADMPVESITKAHVRAWWNRMDPTKPRARSKAFQLLHNLMAGAVDLDLITINPATLPRATVIRTKRAKVIVPLEVAEVEALADAMEPRLRMAVLIGAWCGLRFGELSELRRTDVGPGASTLRIERAVVKVRGGYHVGDPKTDSGKRLVHVPRSLQPDLAAHIQEHAGWGQEGLLFPATNGGHLHATTFARAFAEAAEAIGRPDATPHFLRHSQASWMADLNAPAVVTSTRLGHADTVMTKLYTHPMAEADQRFSDQLSQLREQSRKTTERGGR